MRRMAVAAGLIALAAAGLYVAVVLPAASAPARFAHLATTPLTITIAPPTVPIATTPKAPPVAPAALASILASGEAANLDARLRPSLGELLRTQPRIAAELGPLSPSPAAESVLLLAALDAKDYPAMSAIAPIVVRLAYAAAHGSGGSGILLTIERLARAAALLERARS
jgi:hypothetical protein